MTLDDDPTSRPPSDFITVEEFKARWLAEQSPSVRAFIVDECGGSEAAFARALRLLSDTFDARLARSRGRLQ